MTTERKVWKVEEIRELLATLDDAVLRGLKVLYSLQTANEREWGVTVESNGVGFNGRDAEFMTSLFESYKKYGSLTLRQMAACRRVIKKYAGQLTKVANRQIEV